MMSSHYHFAISLAIIVATATATAADTSYEQNPVIKNYTLNVDQLDKPKYDEFLEDVRKLLATDTYVEGVPLLPPLLEDPLWLDLKLRIEGKETTVKIDGNNLNVVGYQTQETPPKWHELKGSNYIPGATPLSFSGDYRDLSRAAGMSITEVPLSRSAFIGAVEALAGPKPSNETIIAKAVIIVAQMVSEACRFVYIADYFSNNLGKPDTKLEEWMLYCLERKWRDFSAGLLCYDLKRAPKATATDPRSRLGVVLDTLITECGADCDDELPDVVKSATNDPLLAPPPANYSMPRAGDADDRAVV